LINRRWAKKGSREFSNPLQAEPSFSPTRHIAFVCHLPKHASWLNPMEIVFGTIQRRVMRHGNFPSLAALENKLTDFINYFHQTFAKPFDWTYTGRPTKAKTRPRPLT
jgi:hypothetical protein